MVIIGARIHISDGTCQKSLAVTTSSNILYIMKNEHNISELCWSCTKKWEVMYMCVWCTDFASFYKFFIGCWYCSDNVVVFACFSFYYLTSREILSKQIEVLYQIWHRLVSYCHAMFRLWNCKWQPTKWILTFHNTTFHE